MNKYKIISWGLVMIGLFLMLSFTGCKKKEPEPSVAPTTSPPQPARVSAPKPQPATQQPTPARQPTPAPRYKVEIVDFPGYNRPAKLWFIPSASAKTCLAKIPVGTQLEVLDTEVEFGVTWCKVKYKGETGWIPESVYRRK